MWEVSAHEWPKYSASAAETGRSWLPVAYRSAFSAGWEEDNAGLRMTISRGVRCHRTGRFPWSRRCGTPAADTRHGDPVCPVTVLSHVRSRIDGGCPTKVM
ncbi:hypothetical protein GCM10009678_79800 [Actinomadura kijaniata]